ncbi:TonB family protein [Rhodoblastus acidophilus]|uniref:TonB family protein n=1 Tax=Rhodoblastus acidophilus TaxID=1074 RepID=A0A6N8DNU4_RHOAC|nr:TonB family protein [Rhodoblastus acidophilus]MCW2275183.1 protein TonB [Rhodoblastus acidophilus]MTV32149.1 TonB family protein [Rhodoblastus acidophilus]
MTFSASPGERLFERPRPPGPAARGRFAFILVICFLLHATPIWVFINFDRSQELAPGEQEIPVEVVVEPPPKEPEPEPPPPQKEKPLDETIATDAPRPANEEKVERRDAQDDASHSPKTNSVEPAARPPADAAASKPEASPAAEPMDQDPNGEPIVAKPSPAPQEQQKAPQPTPKPDTQKKPAQDPMSAFAALPDYSFAPVSKKTPIATGKAASTYLSIIYGMVMSRIRYPEGAAGHGQNIGEIVFGVDGVGHLVGQRVIKSSGSPELDLAALAAIRAAAPYPPPPTGRGITLNLHYRR